MFQDYAFDGKIRNFLERKIETIPPKPKKEYDQYSISYLDIVPALTLVYQLEKSRRRATRYLGTYYNYQLNSSYSIAYSN